MNSTLSTKTILLLASALGLISFGYFLAGTRRTILVEPSSSSSDSSPTKHRDKDSYQANQVKNTILKNVLTFHDCYREIVKTHPKKLEGKIKMDWQIDPTGEVRTPGVVFSELGNSKLETCLAQKLGAIIFPPPPSSRPYYAFHVFHFKQETIDQKQPQLAMPVIMTK